jgi:hypothetical protein
MAPENRQPENHRQPAASCLLWLLLFAGLGIVTTIAVNVLVQKWAEEEEYRRSHAVMADQMARIGRGEIDCLVEPDPRFIAELLADTACAAKIHDLYVGADLSDRRLGRLRELSNLKCVVFLFAQPPHQLLQQLSGKTSIEAMTFDHTFLSRYDVQQIGGLPRLRSLCLPMYGLTPGDLDGIKNHPSLQSLYLGEARYDQDLIPVLQSLPRLSCLTIQGYDDSKTPNSVPYAIRAALPKCDVRFEGGK